MRTFSALLLAGLLVCAAPLPSQRVPEKYAAEAAVVQRYDTVIAMQNDGTGYVLRTVAVRIQTDASLKELSVVNVTFASASEHVDIAYARARHADGTVTETDVSNALEQPTAVTQAAPFYSDEKVKQLPVRSLHVGDTLEWQARTVRTKAEAPNQFWGQDSFADGVVILEESVELHVPLDSPVQVWTNPEETPASMTKTATERVYRWQHSQLKPLAGKEAEAAAEAKKKKVLTEAEQVDERKGKLPSYAWSTYANWAAVGEWYRGLQQGRTLPDAEVKAKVAELTAGKSGLEEKVRAVYGYVSLQIRYIGVAFGVGRYQPHQAAEVLANQYGDCKDKHTLLAAMLTDLGLHPSAVLIGQGIRLNEALPSPGAFNHLITQVSVGGKTVWLDATEEVAPYDMLWLPLRDVQALVIPEAGAARLERTPLEPPFATVQTMNATGTLDQEGTSQSRITHSLRGDQEIVMRSVVRQVPPANYPELIQKLSEGLGYGGTATNVEFGLPGDTAKAFTWSYDYKREKGGDWEHLKIIPQVAYRSLPVVDEKQPPIEDIDLGLTRTEISTAAMTLPKGWSAELPEAVHVKTAFASYDETYKLANGTLFTDLRIEVTKRYVPVGDWKSYKKFVDQAGLDNQVYVQLTHTGDSGARPGKAKEAGSSSDGASNGASAAAKLVQQGFAAMHANDMALATTLFDQAKALNAEEASLWSGYAEIALRRNDRQESIKDAQRELDLHPSANLYAWLVSLQGWASKPSEMEQTLHAWMKKYPEDPRAATQLMSLLDRQGKASEAVAVGKEARVGFSTKPEEAQKIAPFLLVYGKLLLQSGQDAEGIETLKMLITASEDPDILNSAAYNLADAGKELPLAESTERAVLATLDRETSNWTGAEALSLLQAKSQLLYASWDTMGWILFREGKLGEARDYVSAAFRNRPNPVLGTHLGDIEAAAGDQTGARRDYQLSMPPNGLGYTAAQSTQLQAERAALEAKIAAASKAGARSQPREDSAALRTVHLGPANDRNLSAEYRVLLNGRGVERAEPTGEKSIHGAVEMIKAMKVPHLLPTGSGAQLVKLAIVNCHSDTCDLVFEP